MREKCCQNCLFFRQEKKSHSHYSQVSYHCDFHNLHDGEVSDPGWQFCGDENWTSVKVKTRLKNLEKLGI